MTYAQTIRIPNDLALELRRRWMQSSEKVWNTYLVNTLIAGMTATEQREEQPQ